MVESVSMDDINPITVTLHIRGLKVFKIRMFLVQCLLRLIVLVAPKRIHVGLCDECSNELET